ncbi:hypothetical protein BJX68DRAFT_256200 [Aspergillus pseudodeflectus]|uniref:Zn(2)-C6 fungal-type domain-containing protein n=1 Tax=Aspergillus pseudodeflectus TaxID=176178 RepID=A0ABR4K4P1_9EURO
MGAGGQGACELCRKAKLACDHSQPVCARCTNSNRADACVYRTAPFKRRKTDAPPAEHFSDNTGANILASSPNPTPNRYPNPGFIGSSSHVAIFNHIPGSSLETPSTILSDEAPASCSQPEDVLLVQRAANALKQLLTTFPMDQMTNIVQLWQARGSNLSLAGGILQHCITQGDIITLPILPATFPNDWHILNTKYLLANSNKPLETTHPSTFDHFCAQFTGPNIRWETVGLFLSAVTRAALDIPVAPPLYVDQERRYTLRSLCTRVADYALEIALSLDCLNDLQLFLQYEIWIVHTHVYGDHSYHSWRKLGDVIASIYALGYHENLEQQHQQQQQQTEVPASFLTELRKTVFARVYSGDKNVAIFVGRPPRMSKRFCHFQIPSCSPAGDVWLTGNSGGDGDGDYDIAQWNPITQASYVAESRWTALCASLKEDILCLQRERAMRKGKTHLLITNSKIRITAKEHFSLLPSHFRLRGPLRKCTTRTTDPFERDFIAAVRLNHLHVLFLVGLLQLRTPAEPDGAIIEVAEEIVAIIVDLILLRDQIVNSGTSLVWKIAYYALPAAGILLLAMLRGRSPHPYTAAQQQPQQQRPLPILVPLPRPRTLQHLTILAAELQAGSIIQPREPNFDLMCKAMQTIQSFLDCVTADAMMQVAPPREAPEQTGDDDGVGAGGFDGGDQQTMVPLGGGGEWAGFGFGGQNVWDFEIGFWESLADHPLLNLGSGEE